MKQPHFTGSYTAEDHTPKFTVTVNEEDHYAFIFTDPQYTVDNFSVPREAGHTRTDQVQLNGVQLEALEYFRENFAVPK